MKSTSNENTSNGQPVQSSTIILKRRIPSQNQRDRWHWKVRHADKIAFELALKYAIGGRLHAPETARAVIVTSYRAQLILDHANLVGGSKGLVDSIVKVGLLRDDADQWASIRYEQVKCKRIEERTEIEIFGFRPLRPLDNYDHAKEARRV